MSDKQRIARRISEALGTFLVLALVATLISLWPRDSVPPSGIYPGERIETRSYVISWPPFGDSTPLVARLKWIQWRLANPGLARIHSAAVKVAQRRPWAEPVAQKEYTQMVFEELGYTFQKGCYATCYSSGRILICHYPSMLDNMETKLGLRSYRLKPLQPTGSRALPIR